MAPGSRSRGARRMKGGITSLTNRLLPQRPVEQAVALQVALSTVHHQSQRRLGTQMAGDVARGVSLSTWSRAACEGALRTSKLDKGRVDDLGNRRVERVAGSTARLRAGVFSPSRENLGGIGTECTPAENDDLGPASARGNPRARWTSVMVSPSKTRPSA